MIVTGAVLETVGATRPYVDSRPLWVGDLDLDGPGDREVLVRIEAAGVCHSDLSVVDGNRVRPVPMLLGHEAAGVVVDAGRSVTTVREGQRVVMTFLPRCGECAGCRTGGVRPCVVGSRANEQGTLMDGGVRLHRDGTPVLHHLGVSAFASHAVVDERSVVSIPEEVPASVAAVLGCAVLTGGGAVLNAGHPHAGQTVAVVGLGGVGMAAMITALAHDDVKVIGIDALETKLTWAERLGAHSAWQPGAAVEAGISADIVIEAAGSARAFETAVLLTAPGGRTITVGLPAPDARASISPLALVGGGRSIIGSYLGSAVPERDIPIFVDHWRHGRLPVEQLISGTIPIEDINRAMDDLASGSVLRQMITFPEEN